MAKTKPSKKSKKRDKSILNGTNVPRPKHSPPKEDPTQLLAKATELLQTSQPVEALPLAQKALSILQTSPSKVALLPALNLIAEIDLELGDVSSARDSFIRATEIDPDGSIPEANGGGSEKFLWLAQLSEEGGADSVRWFEKGVTILKTELESLENKKGPQEIHLMEEKKQKLARALCGVVEIYMTDLSWEEDAESRCENLVTEALLVAPNSPETLQTLASVRISQLRVDDAKAALSRSMELWQDLPPEDPDVPDFASRISLSRLLIEVEMEQSALTVLERLIEEDDSSVEAWYLGGWCLFLLGEKNPSGSDPATKAASSNSPDRAAALSASRVWLQHSLKLYQSVEYEDERLRDHAQELVQKLNDELGEAADDDEDDDDEGSEDGVEWEDVDGDEEENGDEDMAET